MTDPARPYATAAPHYLRGRPPYSAQLLDVVRAAIGLDGTGTLIDVGCGPGVLAVQLAPLFDTVIGIDPEPAMLAEARRHAAAHDVEADWIEARAEDLATLELPAARLVTFGQSIHWTDRQPVLATVHELLAPGAAVALIAPAIEHGSPPVDPVAPPIPHDEIEAAARSIPRLVTQPASRHLRDVTGAVAVRRISRRLRPGSHRHRPHDRRGRVRLPVHVLRRPRSFRRSPRRIRGRAPRVARRCLTRRPVP